MADHATLFDDIDSMEPDRFAAHLSDDVSMRFGNAEPIRGRQAARDAWAEFCQGIDGVAHAPKGRWESEEGTVAEAEVTYTKQDGSTVTVPVTTIYRPSRGPIEDYRIYIDLAPLFAG